MNKRYSEEKLNEPEDTLSTSNRPSIDPPEDSQSWEELFDKNFPNYVSPMGRVFFITNPAPAGDIKDFISATVQTERAKLLKQELEQNKRINTEMERRVNEAWESGFKKGFDDCKGLVERGEHAHCCVVPKNEQIDRLATFLMENYPEAITDGGAGDVAIKLLQKSKLEE